MSNANAQKVFVAYEVPDADAGWELEEQDMPESALHDAIIDLLKLVLKAWVTRARLDALIASNLALRWDEKRFKVGVDPDVAVYVPPPPEGEETTSVCTWETGHAPPRIAVEVVSKSTASKDYVNAPNQYAASGTIELWVFDPKRFGPRQNGGPFVLQLWRRDDAGVFRQLYRGDGPCMSPELGAWLVVTDRQTRLRIADDPEGTRLWLTDKERAEQETLRAELARDQAEAKNAGLEAELAALRAELARLRGG
jgi:Uma2 family endonuclease